MPETPPPHEELEDGERQLSQRERETLEELRHLDPQLAGLYQQGLRLLSRLDEPGTTGTLAYVGRELSRGVIDRVLDEEGADALEFEDAADEATLRDELGKALDLSAAEPVFELVLRLVLAGPQHEVRRALDDMGIDITEELDRVLKKGRNRSRIAQALDLPPDDPKVDTWFRLPNDFARWEKYRPGGPPPDDVRRAFETLGDLLYGLRGPYFSTEAELNQLLEVKEPCDADVQRLHAIQLRPVQRYYFFGRLENPKWIEPLRRAGHFKSPPDRQVNPDGSWRARPWPEGEYLVRVAPKAERSVVDVLKALPEGNENPVVWQAVAKAACQMPADAGVGLVPKLNDALRTPGARLFSESVVDLVVRLADGGQDEAFNLASHVLHVESPNAIGEEPEVRYGSNTEWVFPRFGWHGQRELLEALVAALGRRDAERTLKLLLSKITRVKALAEAVEASTRWLVWGLDFETRRDRENVVSEIVGAASELAERMASQGPEPAVRVISILDDFEGDVFKRLRHRVLAAAGEHLTDQVDAFIMSDEPIHTDYSAREVALVLREQFRNASPQARKAFADAVTAGPDRVKLREQLTGADGNEATEADIEEYVGMWQRRRLRWFRGETPEELKSLAEAHGMLGTKPTFEEQELAEVGVHVASGSWGGVEPTPITPEQLSDLSPPEAVEFLSSWQPGKANGTSEGLHTALSQLGRENPTAALAILEQGATIEPSLCESLLNGLLELARNDGELDWGRLVLVVHGVVGRAVSVRDLGSPDALRWRRALSAGLQVIREGCGHDAIRAEALPQVWATLGEATEAGVVWDLVEREPTEDFEAVLIASMNDAAGHFAWAVIAAALCQYRAGLPEKGTDVTDEMREEAGAPVREVLVPLLDRIVAVQGPNSPTVQAVLGQFIPQLHLLAQEWVRRNEELLFGTGVEQPVAHPAWTAYVDRAGLYDTVFAALRPWYAKAVEGAREWAAAAGDARGRGSIGEKLAGHLIVAVLRGLVTPEDEDGLLDLAFENVDPTEWGHAYWGVFRSWSDTDGPPSVELIERLLKFWEWRVGQLSADPESERTLEEAKGLGWLFHTPHIPEADLIRLGQATMRLAKGQLEMYSRWDRMVELAEADPEGAFAIGEAVILAELRSDYPHVPNDVRPFLEHVLRTGKETTRGRAERLVHKLGEKGFRHFRDLIERGDTKTIGILAFGSLREDPGEELEAAEAERRNVTTPFNVEFARYSDSRGGAPTLVPLREGGSPVQAEIIVLSEGTSLPEAKDILWRRETHQVGSGKKYKHRPKPEPKHVLVVELRGLGGLDVVLYTDFHDSGKVPGATPMELAQHAVDSVTQAQDDEDGITYLINAKAAGTVTPKTPEYEAEILRLMGATTLEDALDKARKGELPGS